MKYLSGAYSVIDDNDGEPLWTGADMRWTPRPVMRCWATGGTNFNPWRQEWEELCCLEIGNFTETLGLCPLHYREIVGST